MRIAIGPISGWYGGAAQHINNLIEYSQNDFSPIIVPTVLKLQSIVYRKLVHPRFGKILDPYQHSSLRFDMYGIQKHWDLIGRLISRKIRDSYDVVHLHGHPYWHNIYTNNYKNTVYTVHNLYRKEDFNPIWLSTINMLTTNMIHVCNQSKVVIAVAKWLQHQLHIQYGISSIHIPNGVNLLEISNGSEDRFRSKYNIKDDFFLFVGRATLYKRPRLFAELARELPNKLFVMIGRGLTPAKFEKYMGGNIPGNLILLGEPSRKDVIDAFSACRVFVLTSANETFGIVLLEAMASGKPVVAANHLGPKEIILDGETGVLFDRDSLRSLREKALYAWSKANSLGEAGRELAERKYDWKLLIPNIEEIYAKLH